LNILDDTSSIIIPWKRLLFIQEKAFGMRSLGRIVSDTHFFLPFSTLGELGPVPLVIIDVPLFALGW
jgi:hypothetical protein